MSVRTFDEQDLGNLKQVLDSGVLTARPGGFVERFEREFAAALGSGHGVAMNSAMSLLHGAVSAAGVGPGDEVVCDPIVQFGGISVMYHNGVPVFADVDPRTHNMDPDSVRERVTERTKAIICTNLWGLPCELDRITQIAQQHDLIVIEDCAHALFAEYKGKYAGTWGHIGVFSFQQSKHMTTGDGGMAITNDERLAEEMKVIGTFGSSPRKLSWNYRMTELVGAVGIAQLGRAKRYVDDTIDNARLYTEALAGCEWIVPQRVPEHAKHAYHIYVALFYGDRAGIDYEQFKQAAAEMGCPVSFGYTQRPAYLYPLFAEPLAYGKGCPTGCPLYEGTLTYREGYCPNAEEILPRMMLLSPSGARDAVQEKADKLRSLVRRFE